MKRLAWSSGMVVLLAIFSMIPCSFYSQETKIKIIYTASLEGNLDGCTCAGHPKAGLVKSAKFIRSIRNGSAILVDAGDLLDKEPDDLLAKQIFESYQELGYDAVAVGEREFSCGTEVFTRFSKMLPVLSQNLLLKSEFPNAPRIITKGSVKVGVAAITDPSSFTGISNNSIKFYPREETLKKAVKQLEKENADLKVLLFHGGYDGLTNLLAAVQGIDIAVLGHEQKQIDAQKIGGTLVVSTEGDGSAVGVLDLEFSQKKIKNFKNSFMHFNYRADPDDPAVKKRIDQYQDEMIERLKSGGTK